MLKSSCFILAAVLLFRLPATAQVTFPVNGTTDPRHTLFALTNARLYVDYRTVIDSATLLVRDGIVVDAGRGLAIPEGAVVYNVAGRSIYPSFIDIYADYGLPGAAKPGPDDGVPQFLSNTKGAYGWNQAVRSENDAFRTFTANTGSAAEWRKLGFGAVSTVHRDGIIRGTSALVLLGEGRDNELVLRDRSAAHYSFDKGSSTQDYPSSLMGAIALLRQSFYDAQWYKSQVAQPSFTYRSGSPEYNLSLEAINRNLSLPQIFDAGDKLNILRAAAIGSEFNMSFIIRGNGNEYQRLREIHDLNLPLIVSLNFPDAYDVSDPQEAVNLTLGQLKHWEMAPANAGILAADSIRFALTTADLKKREDFWKNLRKAIAYGLKEEDALKALTVMPASLLGREHSIGSLKKGCIANFIVTSHNLFHKDNVILENWVQGKRYVIKEFTRQEIRGTYTLDVTGLPPQTMTVTGDWVAPEIVILEDTAKIKVPYSRQADHIQLNYDSKKTKQSFRLVGTMTDSGWEGRGQRADGQEVQWTARLVKAWQPEVKPDTARRDTVVLGKVTYPFTAYGWTTKPEVRTVLFRNATVWTGESAGNLENTDVLARGGKIVQVGKNIPAGDALVVDATGKFLTAGIIDEHSHIAVNGPVNEATQASSAEVRIGDVIDCEDIDIYRQLAGGVTSSHILHGSANPIGGQTQLLKLRWGLGPEELKFKGWPGQIKFALGENVKQAHWGDKQVTRFPQTRMGVEQVYTDYFTRAREYDAAWKKFGSAKKGTAAPPRKDLELDALAEILNKKRFITCHSYVQSEINMLMHVADTFGFTVNTFTHILEGYKVADKMKKHGAGASSFSDWWAYKYEVYEAIPYNGALMHKAGLTVAYNSDDAEMARRLNQEAAKAVRYGGVSPEEAWKFVTLNPAKLLRIDDKTGSIAVGKDADLVLWNGSPLSIYTKVLQTWVDGVKYYDADEDIRLRAEVAKERARLIQKMIEAKKKGDAVQLPVVKFSLQRHCMGEDEYFLHHENHSH